MKLLILILTVFVSWLLTSVIRKQAIKRSIVDIPNHRSSHDVPTPRGGGLAIAITWYVGLLFMKFIGEIDAQIFYALLGGIPLLIISLLDDIKDLSARIRLLFQMVSAGIGILVLFGSNLFDFQNEQWGLFLIAAGFAFVAIIWFVNLFNFLDGIDGYLGMEAVSVFFALFFLTHQRFLLILVFAVIGFLYWNWPKAKIFCGDVGSTMIGYNVAIISLWLQTSGELNILIPIILTMLFWLDATYTIIRRGLNKENISQPHRKHAYQRLVQSGWSHKTVLIIGISINMFLFGFAYLYHKSIMNLQWMIVLSLMLGGGYLALAQKRKPFLD